MSLAAIAKPVVMSAAMAAAISEGRKTTFREAVTPQPINAYVSMVNRAPGVWSAEGSGPYSAAAMPQDAVAAWRCPYGVPGDRLYVQEPWNKHGGTVSYLADGDWIADYLAAAVPPVRNKPKWEDADAMPQEYARLVLEVVRVQAKHLQAISAEQAMDEGMPWDAATRQYIITEGEEYKGRATKDPKFAFYMVWESMRTGHMWANNPWVWVVEFKVVRDGR